MPYKTVGADFIESVLDDDRVQHSYWDVFIGYLMAAIFCLVFVCGIPFLIAVFGHWEPTLAQVRPFLVLAGALYLYFLVGPPG